MRCDEMCPSNGLLSITLISQISPHTPHHARPFGFLPSLLPRTIPKSISHLPSPKPCSPNVQRANRTPPPTHVQYKAKSEPPSRPDPKLCSSTASPRLALQPPASTSHWKPSNAATTPPIPAPSFPGSGIHYRNRSSHRPRDASRGPPVRLGLCGVRLGSIGCCMSDPLPPGLLHTSHRIPPVRPRILLRCRDLKLAER